MNLPDRINYAKALAEATLLPQAYRKAPANVLLAMEYGEALGLSPIAAIQGVNIIDGKPTASAQLIGSLVRRAGHRLRVEADDTGTWAEAIIIRSDDPDYTFRSRWDLKRAEFAGLLGKGAWKQYPSAMLKARAITEVARDACPEALSGVAYTPEEIERPTQPVATIIDTEVIDLEAEDAPMRLRAIMADRVAHTKDSTITEKQLATLHKVIDEQAVDLAQLDHFAIEVLGFSIPTDLSTLSKNEASILLDSLLRRVKE